MRANKAKQTLVNFSETEFISGLPYFHCFFLLLVLLFDFSSTVLYASAMISPAFKKASVAICCFRFTDFIDSFIYRLRSSLPYQTNTHTHLSIYFKKEPPLNDESFILLLFGVHKNLYMSKRKCLKMFDRYTS